MSEYLQNKKYNYLIVPCPGDPTILGDKVKFANLENDKSNSELKLFLGAEDRMKAAILKAKEVEKVVLVGGSLSKILAMYVFFKQQIKKKENENMSNLKFICLISHPDSTGNFSAFKKYLEKNNLHIKNIKIAIISNEYHLDRLRLIWSALFDDKNDINWFSAEEILKTGIARDMYKKEIEYRKIKEEEGCRDWLKKQYNRQDYIINWDSNRWRCQEIDLNFNIEEYEN